MSRASFFRAAAALLTSTSTRPSPATARAIAVLDAFLRAHVELHRHRAPAGGFYARGDVRELLDARGGHRDVEAVARERDGDLGAYALRGAGDEAVFVIASCLDSAS